MNIWIIVAFAVVLIAVVFGAGMLFGKSNPKKTDKLKKVVDDTEAKLKGEQK